MIGDWVIEWWWRRIRNVGVMRWSIGRLVATIEVIRVVAPKDADSLIMTFKTRVKKTAVFL